jgi:uncharacterized membrane-anchored protein YjiN (DUF445 family)
VPPRRSHVGTVSLLAAAGGALVSRAALTHGPLADAGWLHVVSAGFEAALVGGLADWFAVTALFRHPLGLPIPHTAIIAARRDKIIDSIVAMVEDEWLSPEVIGARLRSIAPSDLVVDWLADEEHVRRLGAPLRDVLRGVARILTEPEVVEFVGRTVRGQLSSLPIDAAAGRWLARMAADSSATAAFQTAVLSLARLLVQPSTTETLHAWMEHAATELHKDGKRVVPMLLRRRIVQRAIVDTGCHYAASELLLASEDPDHPLRRWAFANIASFAERLGAGDPAALAHVERLRVSVLSSLAVEPLVRDLLSQFSGQVDRDLAEANGYLSDLVDRKLRSAILELLADPQRREALDRWVRTTADDLLRKNHHQIGVTVRENLEALKTDDLVKQIEDRVGADLQFIRLNGALVGGLIGVLLALVHRFVG